MKRALIAAMVVATAAHAEKAKWPVVTLKFTIADGTGWKPADVSVPEGAEVRLVLENASNAPACFEIGGKEKGTFVKSPVCLDVDETREDVFFANVDKGTYRIRNRYEHQQAGKFTVK
jgi:hypothetical protein